MRNPAFALLPILAVLACTKTEPEDTSPPCTVEIDETFPADGATNAYYRGAIEFHLSDPDSSATITIDGVDGVSSANEEGDVITFTPSAPLAPSTPYTASLSYCRGDASISFTTSALGGTIADPSSLNNRVYTLDLQAEDVRIVIPEGVGSVLESYLDVTLFIQVADANSSTLSMFGAVADDAGTAQDYCSPTLDFPTAEFTAAPYFEVGPQTTTISVADYTVTIEDLYISGTFATDGSYWGGGVLSGSVDTRPLVDLVEEGGEDGAICEIVAGFGVACETCPADGQPYCLSIKAVGLGGDEVTSTSLEEIEMADCHEMCPDSAANPECML